MDILVMGGSFNPPTLAHEIILGSAVNEMNASSGIFVPSSDAYVRRKMNKTNPPGVTYPEAVRLKMLEAVCAGNPGLKVSACEFGDDGKGHTYDTLLRLKKEMPDADLWFIVGADKLRIIPKWHSAEKLLRDFGLAVLARKGTDPEKAVAENAFLSAHASSFRFLTTPEGISDISSTKVRELAKTGRFDEAGKLVGPETLDLLRKYHAGGERRNS